METAPYHHHYHIIIIIIIIIITIIIIIIIIILIITKLTCHTRKLISRFSPPQMSIMSS